MLADNRKQRRARERSEARKSRRVQKAVVALSASKALSPIPDWTCQPEPT